VLNNHDRYSGVEAILGVVEDASVDGQRGEAVVRFGTRPEIQGVIADVRAGIIRNVSVGYSVEEWRETRENGKRVKTATRWTPREISFVPLGADPAATIRTTEVEMECRKIKATCKCRRATSPPLWRCPRRRPTKWLPATTTLMACEASSSPKPRAGSR
jgi:phage head maturation protease